MMLTCSQCGRKERRSVVYGYFDRETAEAKRGSVVFGGCMVGLPLDWWRCKDCELPRPEPIEGDELR